MKDKFKMLIELRITDKNIINVEEIISQLFQKSIISLADCSDVLTAIMCFKALNSENEEEPNPSNVISIFDRKVR